MPEFDPRPVLIYFLQTQSYVKIGKTEVEKIAMRLQRIRGSTPLPVELIRLICGPEELERWFHFKLRDLRFSGEWFRYSDRIMTLAPPRPDLWVECDPRGILKPWKGPPWITFSKDSPFADDCKEFQLILNNKTG